MKTIAISSQKGGVGKTTVSLNLAYAMANMGLRTLLVDTDPQGGIGLSLFGGEKKPIGVSEWLRKSGPIDAFIRKTRLPELSIMQVGQEVYFEAAKQEYDFKLDRAKLADLLRQASGFDVVIFDTPAGLSGVTATVMVSVDMVVIPIQCEPLSLRAVPQAMRTLCALKSSGASIRLGGFVVTMDDESEFSLRIRNEMAAAFPGDLLLEPSIPRDEMIRQASLRGVPLALASRGVNKPLVHFDRLAVTIAGKLQLASGEVDDTRYLMV